MNKLRVSCFLLLISLCSVKGQTPLEITRAPYLQLATESSQVIVWRTNKEILPSVRVGKSLGSLDQILAGEDILVKSDEALWQGEPSKSPPVGTVQYEAYISGLEPSTKYYYALYDGEKRLTPSEDSYYLKTHPKVGTNAPSRFWIVGDSGTGGEAQKRVHDGLNAYLGKERELDGYLHVGDMAYGSGTDPQFSERYFSMYEPTLRHTVCWGSMGNHEGQTSQGETGTGPYYDAYVLPTKAEAGGTPSGTEAYYSFDYGDVHFICLNSHDLDRSPTAAMAQWLKADLEKTQAQWLVAFFHHPPYTKGSHDSDNERQLIEMRENIMPILESGGVDVVYTGHSHIYERTMLIDGAYHTPSINEGVVLDDGDGDPKGDGSYKKSAGLAPNNGTVQIVAGHGGTGLRMKDKHVLMSKIIVLHGSVIMETEENRMNLKMIDVDGKMKDHCVIEKGGKVPRNIVTNPRDPVVIIGEGHNNKKKSNRLPKDHRPLFPQHDEWFYLAGKELHPVAGWPGAETPPSSWKKGKAGFGYGDEDDNTLLEMRNEFTTVYTWKEFTLKDASEAALHDLGLAIKYDDGFIAYINGGEVQRKGVDKGSGKYAKGVRPHEAKGYEFFPLGKHHKLFKKGKNTIAIEGHNANLGSSDFTLDAFLTYEH